MSHYTQDEIDDTWERLKDGDDLGDSRITMDGPFRQGLRIIIPARGSDEESVGYARQRESKETQ
jgi:hypothetical protein